MKMNISAEMGAVTSGNSRKRPSRGSTKNSAKPNTNMRESFVSVSLTAPSIAPLIRKKNSSTSKAWAMHENSNGPITENEFCSDPSETVETKASST